jgi:hypothetical protein
MADSTITTVMHDGTEIEINLKDRRLAAFLAWLIPGLGHIYQGRTGKGVLFFVCIVGTFVYGLAIGQGRVVYASTADVFSREFLERWQFICQIGVGLPAMPALVQRERILNQKEPLVADWFMRPPYTNKVPPPEPVSFTTEDGAGNVIQHPDELAMWNYKLGELFELGTVFTVIAGLLNILAIYDAYGGPLVLPAEEKKPRDEDSRDNPVDVK